MIFNIQRFSTHDGKGIRTIIFFKGCPLRCQWCSNPESQNPWSEIFFASRKCLLCLDCINKSAHGEFSLVNNKLTFNKSQVQNPLVFKDICPSKAIEVIGTDPGIDEILAEIIKDLPFYHNSGGGVTLSGGEPFLQPEFLAKLIHALQQHCIHISVETCLHVPWKSIARSLPSIDEFLADFKHIDPVKFYNFTGGDVNLVLSNFKELETAGANVILRIPVIPGFNDMESEMHSMIDFIAGLKNVQEIHFIPYHTLGAGKYELLGRNYPMPLVSVADGLIQEYVAYAQNKGLTTTIGG